MTAVLRQVIIDENIGGLAETVDELIAADLPGEKGFANKAQHAQVKTLGKHKGWMQGFLKPFFMDTPNDKKDNFVKEQVFGKGYALLSPRNPKILGLSQISWD